MNELNGAHTHIHTQSSVFYIWIMHIYMINDTLKAKEPENESTIWIKSQGFVIISSKSRRKCGKKAIAGSDADDAVGVVAVGIADVSLRIQTGSQQIMHSGDNFSFCPYFPFAFAFFSELRVQGVVPHRMRDIVSGNCEWKLWKLFA